MRLGRKQRAAVWADPILARYADARDSGVAVSRPIEQARVCSQCLVVNGASDAYCTACGTELSVADLVPAADTARPALDPPLASNELSIADPASTETEVTALDPLLASIFAEAARKDSAAPVNDASTVIHPRVPRRTFSDSTLRSRKWRSRIAVVALILLGVAATSTFAWLWNAEKALHHRVAGERNVAAASLRSTKKQLGRTIVALHATSALANQRKAVLVKAQSVLGKVYPLLSDADHIEQVTGDIQLARDTFAYDSSQMTTDLLYLENYEANPQNYPGVDQWGLVAQVNAELATVRGDYAALTAGDGRFSDASTTFGNHATAFTEAVRKLQAQLQRAVSK